MAVRVAIYGRASSRRQKAEQTIETQVAVCEAYCSKQGYEVVGRYLDQAVQNTVPMEKRAEGARLLRDAAAGAFNLVIVYALDRLSREASISDPVLFQLERLRIGFDSATETLDLNSPEGRQFYRIKMVFASMEGYTFEQRVSDGRRRLAGETWQASDGRYYSYWLGGQAPLGFRVIDVGHRRALVPNEEAIPGLGLSEAEVVRLIYRWLVEERLTLVPIANRLNSMGVPTHSQRAGTRGRRSEPAATRWHMSSVNVILRNPIYRGERTFSGIEQTFPALVDEATWYRAQEIIRDNRIVSTHDRKAEYLLRGKLHCGYCGAALVGCPRYNKVGHRWGDRFYYVCGTVLNPKRFPERHCTNRRIPGEVIDALVWEDLREFVRNPGNALERLREQTLDTDSRGKTLQRQLDRLRALVDTKVSAMKLTLRAYTHATIDAKQLQGAMTALKTEHTEYLRQADQLDEAFRNNQALQKQLEAAEVLLLGLHQGDLEEFERRRRLVELFVNAIRITPSEVEISYVFTPRARRTRVPISSSPGSVSSYGSIGPQLR